jgi:hypothetical protein
MQKVTLRVVTPPYHLFSMHRVFLRVFGPQVAQASSPSQVRCRPHSIVEEEYSKLARRSILSLTQGDLSISVISSGIVETR